MRKRILFILLLSALALIITSCTQNQANQKNNEVFFEQITANEITDSEISDWFTKKHEEYGVHKKDDKNGTYTYVIVSSGMRPTGGYSMSIEKTDENSETITFKAYLEKPGENDNVTQAITYPNVLLKVKSEDKDIVVIGLEDIDELNYNIEVNDKLFLKGIYNGRIDSNFIEVSAKDEIMVFLYPLAKETNVLREGSTVEIKYTVGEDEQKHILSITEHEDQIVELEITGIYTGRQDNNFIEVKSEDEYLVFKYRVEKQNEELGDSFAENTLVNIQYYVDANGQKQILSIEKTPE